MDSAVQSYADMAASLPPPPASAAGATTAGLAKLGNGTDVDKASQDFEAMFMTQMLQPMFEGVGNDATFGGGHGEEVMKTFLLQEYGKIAAKRGTLGIASHVKDQMIKAQAIASNSKAGKEIPNAAVQ